MAKHIKVLSVVVAYNPYRSGFFPRCLEALLEMKLDNENYQIDHQILVVDNSSTDDTRQLVRKNFPRIELVLCDNIGYAGGNNVGFDRALAREADYIAVVTHDVTVTPNWLLNAVDVAETDKRIGVVQPLLLLWSKKDVVNSIGNAIHFLGYGYAGGYMKPVAEINREAITDIPYASGACILVRSQAIRDVGGFDEEMWMYNEDEDLGWRMNLLGYRNVLAPQSEVYHQYEFSRSISKLYFMDRNRILVMLQNYHWATLLILAPVILLNEIATLALAYAGGWHREKLRVWRYFLRRQSWRVLLIKRRLRQTNRIVKEQVIVSRFTGEILFQDVMNPVVKYFGNPLLAFFWKICKCVILW